jgi:hypothetical protein
VHPLRILDEYTASRKDVKEAWVEKLKIGHVGSTTVIFVVPKLFAANGAAALRRMLQVVMPLERTCRGDTPVANAATKWPVAGRHGYFLSSPVLASDSLERSWSVRLFAASSKQPPYDTIPDCGAYAT